MLHRGANYRVQGLAQGPVRQSTGSRSHVRLRNHFRRCQMSRVTNSAATSLGSGTPESI